MFLSKHFQNQMNISTTCTTVQFISNDLRPLPITVTTSIKIKHNESAIKRETEKQHYLESKTRSIMEGENLLYYIMREIRNRKSVKSTNMHEDSGNVCER